MCGSHGGRAPQIRAAARGRLAQQRAIRDLSELGYEPVGDPFAALADLAGRAVALERWAERQVAALGDDLTSTDRVGSEEVRATLRLLERSLERAGKLVESCAKLNVADRQVKIDEAKADLVIRLIASSMRQVNIPPQAQADLWAVFKREIAREQVTAPTVVPIPRRTVLEHDAPDDAA